MTDEPAGQAKARRIGSGAMTRALMVLFAGLSISAPLTASAEDERMEKLIQPLTVDEDPNGVDMLTGKVAPRLPTLAIPAAPRLSFTRLIDWLPQISGYLPPKTPGTQTYSLTGLGGTSEAFSCDNGEDCRDEKHAASTLTADYFSGYFVFKKGGIAERVTYSVRTNSLGPISGNDHFYFMASSVAYPDGESLTFTWQDRVSGTQQLKHRPASVSSSTGYKLVFSYRSDDPGNVSDWSSLQSARIVKESDPGVTLASLTYTDTTVTDMGGRVYACAPCTNDLASPIQTTNAWLRLPGETATTFAASAVVADHGYFDPHAGFVTDIDSDGVHYDYSYLETDWSRNYERRLSRVTVTAPGGFSRVVNIQNADSAHVKGTFSRISSIKDSQGQTTTYGYGAQFLKLTSITYPEGNSVEIAYDGPVNITEMRHKAKPGSGLSDIVETAGYDPWGTACEILANIKCFLPNWTRDAEGNQTDYTWAPHGGLLTQLDPAVLGVRRLTKNSWSPTNRLIKQEICEADDSGTALTCGTADSFVREFTYFGNTALPLTETVTDGVGTAPLTTTYSYDEAGRLLSQDGPLPGSDDAAYYRYDSLGRRTWEIGAVNEQGYRPATRTTYRDADDKPITVETGRVNSPTDQAFVLESWATTTYMDNRLPAKVTVRSPGVIHAVTQFNYDSRNREKCVAVRMNPAEFSNLPGACTLSPEDLAFGPDRITRKAYDSESRLLSLTKGVGTSLEQAYATYSYTANGKQASLTDARGFRAEMTYDGFDRQKRWIFPSKTQAGVANNGDYEEYGYDKNGNRTSLRKRDDSTLTFNYDALNRVTRKTVPERSDLAASQTRDVFYRYDIRGLPIKTRFDSASGDGQTITYDRYGLPVSSNLKMDGVTRSLSYAHNEAGSRISLTFPDSQTFTYAYGPGGQINKIKDPVNNVLLDYQYDDWGRVQQLWRNYNAPEQDWTYDAIGRLLSTGWANAGSNSVSWSYTRNAASQILTETQSNDSYSWGDHADQDLAYAANGLNQYTSIGSVSPCHDANGNLTRDDTYAYLYDVENRLVEMRVKQGGSCPSVTSGYGGNLRSQLSYDPLGRLYEVKGYTGASVLSSTTRFLHDGDALVAEYDGTGTLLRRHVHGPAAGVDDPLVSYPGSSIALSDARFLYADPRGSIVYSATRSNGAPVISTYDAWGAPDGNTMADLATHGRFRYTGQVWLPEIGMYYYKARIYSPSLGRFLQTDPIGYEDQVNLYAYVGNDPVNGVDPTGMFERGDSLNWNSGLGRVSGKDKVTTEVKSTPIPIQDENGESNSELVQETVSNFIQEAVNRTEESGFTREYGVTLSLDEKQKTFVVSLFQGPIKSLLGGGLLGISPTHRKLLYFVHTHTAVGVEQPSVPTIIGNWARGGTNTPGPSSTGPKNDRASAENWRRINNPNARFGVIYRTPTPGGGTQWNYEGY